MLDNSNAAYQGTIDTTLQKQADLARLEMLDKIIALMPGHVYWIDKEGRYLGCNDQQAKSAGLVSREDIVGKRNKDLPWNFNATVLPEMLDKINEEVMKTGKAVVTEEPGTLTDGTKKIFLSNKVPLLNNEGHVVGMVGISVDITKEKQVQEALEQANRARLEFISTASHEVRGPVSCVVSLADRLKKNITTLQDMVSEKTVPGKQTGEMEPVLRILAETLENCQDMRDAAESGMVAIKNLSDLHHMQLSGVTAMPTCFNIQQFLDIAIKKSTYPNTNNIFMERYVSPALSQDVMIDGSNVMRALSIVIGNAFRFSHPDGKINITVKKASESKGTWLVISVQDFGVGMHKKQIDDLSTTLLGTKTAKESLFSKPSVQLSRAKMYLEASKSRLEIESVLEQGTEVKLIVSYQLPVLEKLEGETIIDPALQQNTAVKKLAMHAPYEPICTVLLVEDDIVTQKITSQKLAELGYQVDVAKSGAEAIQMAIANDYAVALLDITLPDMNGLDVMRQIRASKGEETIFIAVSSHASEEQEEYFMTEGVMALLAKPVTSKQLKSVLDSALKIKAGLDRE